MDRPQPAIDYRLLLESTGEGMYCLDRAGCCTFANRAAAELLGYRVEELLGQRMHTLIHHHRADGSPYPAEECPIEGTLRTGRGCRTEGEVLWRRDGSSFAVESASFPMVEEGRVTGVVVTFHDVSERLRTEAALRESEARNRALLEAIPDLMFRVRGDGTLLDYQAKRTDDLYAPPEAFIGRRLDEVLPPDVAAAGLQGIARALATHQVQDFEYELLLPIGRRAFEARVAVSGPDEVLVIVRDITEERRARETVRFLAEASTLLASSLDYETTLASVTRLAVASFADWCCVDVIDEEGAPRRVAVAHANPAKDGLARALQRSYRPQRGGVMERVLQTGRAELIPEVSPALRRMAATDPERGRQIEEMDPRSMMVTPLVARGRTLGAVFFAITETSRRYGPTDLALAEDLAGRVAVAIDNALLYREAREAVSLRDQFLSIASHELRTPVTGVKGYAELLQRQLARGAVDEQRMARYLRAIARASDRLDALTSDLLDVSRLHMGQLQPRLVPLDLAEQAREVVGRYTDRLDEVHTLAVETPEGPCRVLADPDRLEQVLTNLLENAVKYSPEGGAITVTVRPEDDGCVLAVRDEGIGLPPGPTDAIFAPFGHAPNALDRQLPGLGLGLYICQDIVTRQGGRIRAESAGENQGTTVSVWLPAEQAESAGTAASTAADGARATTGDGML